VVNGFVVAINLSSGGNGYFTAPPVTIIGTGSNAQAVAFVSGGSVTNIAVTDAGFGYSTNTQVEIGPSSFPDIASARLYVGLEIVGQVGNTIDLQSGSSLDDPYPWMHLTTITQTVNPQLYIDPVGSGKAFYRALPVPTNPNPSQLVWVPPGTFTMGSPPTEPGRNADELQHSVSITKGFWVGRHEVTQDDYIRVMLSTPSFFNTNVSLPVESVTWQQAQDYCNNLTQREQDAGRLPAGYVYRLPTEAEWEYAARASSSQAYFFGPDPQNLPQYAWFVNNSGSMTELVATKTSNPTGLFDTYGNVAEWCADWYGPYAPDRVLDPTGPPNGTLRAVRGGSWSSTAAQCRSASRDSLGPTAVSSSVGFRVVLAEGTFTGPTNPSPGRLVWIPPGDFVMGSPVTESARNTNETQHHVIISQGFWIAKYEVTLGEYRALTGAQIAGDTNKAAAYIYWYDAANYCALLTEQERQAGRLPAGFVYRLPTEAEWEYVARGGTKTRFHFGDDLSYLQLPSYAWFNFGGSIGNQQMPGGLKLPSPQGVYDLYGNVMEWCADWYGPYPVGPTVDPKGPPGGQFKICRGGTVYLDGSYCRSADRYYIGPWDYQNMYYPCGIRVVLGRP
jgi:formylglycine-generating enzyme required for sulfatase activity